MSLYIPLIIFLQSFKFKCRFEFPKNTKSFVFNRITLKFTTKFTLNNEYVLI